MQATHDAADAVVDAGAGATKASEDFATYYANVSDEVAGGKTLPKDGDFITGDLCPSLRPLDRRFFEKLETVGPATPVALSMSLVMKAT